MDRIEPYYMSMLRNMRLPDYYMVLIGAIVFLQFNCLYLVDGDAVPVSDASLGLVAMLFASVYMLALIASYTAVYNYHQPFAMGFRALRNWYGIMLLYFPVSKLLRVGRLHADQLVRMMIAFAIVYVALGTLQFMVGIGATILHVSTGERYGSVRLWMDMTLPVLAYFITLARLLKSEGSKIVNICIAVSMLAFSIFVIKTRMNIVTMVLATLIAVLMQRNTLKKITEAMGFLLIVGLSLSSQIGSDILNMVMGRSSTQLDTATIRVWNSIWRMSPIPCGIFCSVTVSRISRSLACPRLPEEPRDTTSTITACMACYMCMASSSSCGLRSFIICCSVMQ